jgi:hypothetical protein
MERSARRPLLVSTTWIQAVVLDVLRGFFSLGLLAYRTMLALGPALFCRRLVAGALAARWLARDLRVHPANFPEPSPSQGLRMAVTGADGRPKGQRCE